MEIPYGQPCGGTMTDRGGVGEGEMCRDRASLIPGGSEVWVCTRKKGHSGRHEAGVDDIIFAVWEDLAPRGKRPFSELTPGRLFIWGDDETMEFMAVSVNRPKRCVEVEEFNLGSGKVRYDLNGHSRVKRWCPGCTWIECDEDGNPLVGDDYDFFASLGL